MEPIFFTYISVGLCSTLYAETTFETKAPKAGSMFYYIPAKCKFFFTILCSSTESFYPCKLLSRTHRTQAAPRSRGHRLQTVHSHTKPVITSLVSITVKSAGQLSKNPSIECSKTKIDQKDPTEKPKHVWLLSDTIYRCNVFIQGGKKTGWAPEQNISHIKLVIST